MYRQLRSGPRYVAEEETRRGRLTSKAAGRRTTPRSPQAAILWHRPRAALRTCWLGTENPTSRLSALPVLPGSYEVPPGPGDLSTVLRGHSSIQTLLPQTLGATGAALRPGEAVKSPGEQGLWEVGSPWQQRQLLHAPSSGLLCQEGAWCQDGTSQEREHE